MHQTESELDLFSLHWIPRTLLIWVIDILGLLLLIWVLPGLAILDWSTAFWSILIIGFLNALLWPTLIYFTLPLTVFTFGLITLVVNGLLIWILSQIDPGFSATGFWDIALAALGLTIINSLLIGFLAIDFHDSYHSYVIKQFASKKRNAEKV